MASAYKPEEARVPPALPLPAPPVTKFKIALCQLSVTPDKERNIAHSRKAIEDAAAKGAQLVSSLKFGMVRIQMTVFLFMLRTLMRVAMHLLQQPCCLKLLNVLRSPLLVDL